jgi:hypothetical protein
MLTRTHSKAIVTALLFCFCFAGAVHAQQTYIITDGKSLKEGLDIYVEFRAGTRRVTWEEAVRATEAATYTQAFAKGCYMWQQKAPEKAPFTLPHELIAEQFAKVVHKYLSDHPDKLGEGAEFLVFDAVVSAFPRK